MAIITGTKSVVDGVQRGLHWWAELYVLDKPLVHTGSKGAAYRVDGNQGWRGMYAAYGHTPYKMPGEVFQFTRATRAGEGYQSGTVGAICNRVRIVWPVSQRAPITVLTWFSGATGALVAGSQSITVASVTAPPMASGRSIWLGGEEQGHIVGMTLDIWRRNPRHKDTSTAGYIERIKGNLDAEISYHSLLSDFTDLPGLQEELLVAMEATSSTNWTIKYGKVVQLRPILVARSPGRPQPVGAQVRLRLTSEKDSVAGSITQPDGTQYWPAA